MRSLIKNKKGNMIMIMIFFALLFIVLFLGLIFVIGSSVINWVFDEAVPELSNLGQIDKVNMTDVAGMTLVPLNTFIQSFTWITGVLYVMMLIALVGVIVASREAPSRWLIGFYLVLTISLIFASILVSNIYEEIYTGTDEFASILKEHVILSNMILYSPAIFTVITFLTGIVLFSGMQREEYV